MYFFKTNENIDAMPGTFTAIDINSKEHIFGKPTGIQDNVDNCPDDPNSDQLDTDEDGQVFS